MDELEQSTGGRSRRSVIFPLIVGLLLIGAIAVVVVTRSARRDETSPPTPTATALPGVQVFDELETDHVDGSVNYEVTPPVGGPHHDIPQTCDFYAEPVRNENAVHSLEHGAVWITFDPDLPADEVDMLRTLAGRKVLVSPFPNLRDRIVASAWGRQLKVEAADDPRLEGFIEAFVDGAQSPEPNAACQGVTQPR